MRRTPSRTRRCLRARASSLPTASSPLRSSSARVLVPALLLILGLVTLALPLPAQDPSPAALVVLPGDGSTNVSLTEDIEIGFNMAMNHTSVEGALSITPPLVHALSWRADVLVITPQILSASTVYTVIVDASATSQSGMAIEHAVQFSFTTRTVATDERPTILSQLPTPNSHTNVPLVAFTFDKTMDKTSVESAFALSPAVEGIVRWEGQRFEFTPSEGGLVDGTSYTITLGPSARTLSGVPLASASVATFVYDSTAPGPVVADLADASELQQDHLTLALRFSEPIERSSVVSGLTLVPAPPEAARLRWDDDQHLAIEIPRLTLGSTYKLDVSGALDQAGNAQEHFTLTFSVYAQPRARLNGTELEAGQGLEFIFSRPMDKPATEGAIHVNPAVSRPVFAWDSTGTRLAVFPEGSGLDAGTYQVIVGTEATDVQGHPLAEPYSRDVVVLPVLGGTSPNGGFAPAPDLVVALPLAGLLAIVAIIGVVLNPYFQSRAEARRRVRGETTAVESYGLVQRGYLLVLGMLDARFRLRYLFFRKTPTQTEILKNINRQMPRTHTEKYNLKTIWYWYPLYCLGGISFVAFILLVITGIFLGFYYVPKGEGIPSDAYSSMQLIMTKVPFGYVMRSLHHWAAHFMVAAVFLHMCRVYFVGAYKNPRELNWLLGAVLLLLTIGLGYTGYLLPWDQLAFGAGTIGIEMTRSTPVIGDVAATLVFGGVELSGLTVLRMYWLHVFILPILGVGLMVLHMVIVWLQGVAEPH